MFIGPVFIGLVFIVLAFIRLFLRQQSCFHIFFHYSGQFNSINDFLVAKSFGQIQHITQPRTSINRSPWLGDVLDLAKRLGNQEIIDAIELARIVEKNMKARLLPQKQSDESKHDENEPNENGSDEHELNEDSMMLDEHEYEI